MYVYSKMLKFNSKMLEFNSKMLEFNSKMLEFNSKMLEFNSKILEFTQKCSSLLKNARVYSKMLEFTQIYCSNKINPLLSSVLNISMQDIKGI